MTSNTTSLTGTAFARSLHISERFGVVYVNNPKVACSTIKLTLQRAELQDPAFVPRTSVHDRSASPLLTGNRIRGRERDHLDGKFVFSFVRNPFDRLKSVYLNKIVTPQKQGSFRRQAGFPEEYCPTFEEFTLAVCDQPADRQNAHWRPQTLNLSFDRLSFDFIGRLESFDADWQQLAEETGLPPETHFAGKRSDVSDKHLLTFTEKAVEAINRAYARDFERLGYETRPIPPP